MMLELKKYRNVYITCAVLGTIAFLAVFGLQPLCPWNTAWLMGEGSDLTQHYIGWVAFRQSSWNFPIGCTDNLAYPFETSVIFTDSIPLFAVIFKLLSPGLPETFQYFGIYGLLCYGLQAFLAAVLLKKYLKCKTDIVLGSMFFTFSTVMVARMYYHTALASHFLLLLTMLGIVYYEESFCRTKEAVTLSALTAFLAASIHLYFLAMCGFIWASYCILDLLKTKKPYRSVLVVGTFLIVAAGVIWLLGGFNGVFGAARGGLGNYGMNLNAFFNSQDNSAILRGLKLPDIDVAEGYAYLGAGMIVLLLYDIFAVIADRQRLWGILKVHWEKVLAVLLLVTADCLFAVLPAVYWSDRLLFELELPQFIQKIWGVFRATGRFSWIVFYLCFLAIIITLFTLSRQKSRILSLILAGALVVQIYDIMPQIAQKRMNVEEWDQHPAELTDPCWDELARSGQVKHVYFGFSDMEPGVIYPVTQWAVTHDMTVNRFYFARSLNKEAVADILGQAMWEKNEDSIFVFRPEDKEFCEKNGFSYIVTKENLLLGGKNIG